MSDARLKSNATDMEVEQQTELMYRDDTIWTAVFKADRLAIERLIERDANVVHTRGAVGECPIHMLFLCGTDAHLDIAQDLLRRFPAIVTQTYNKPIYFGENVLHIAIVKRSAAMVAWLLEDEHLQDYRQELLQATATGDFFKIGAPSYYGETPLGFACCTNQWDIVEILLRYGANMNTMDTNGNNILHMLVICNLPEIYAQFKARWVEKQEPHFADSLSSRKLESSKLWNHLNSDGFTPLTLAADLGRAKMLSWLLKERMKVQWSYGDISCLLHPLDQLDLDFESKEHNRPLSVLEVIIKNNDASLIQPIIISLIDKKWKYFAYRILMRRFLVTVVYLLVFLLTTILEQTRLQTDGNEQKATHFLCRLGHTIVVGGALFKGGQELKEMSNLGLRNYLKSTGSVFLENCLGCSFCLCILLVAVFRVLAIDEEAIILAVASLIGWAYMLFFIMPFRFTGPFVIMLYKMLFNDVLRFCIIYTIFLAGFAQAFFILFNTNGVYGYASSMKHCFLGLLGDFDLEYYAQGSFPVASISLLILYIVIVTILLLNLLIAMMGDTYADVKRSAKQLWHLERTRIALDIEKGMSTVERQMKTNKYWVDVQGDRYLQVEHVDNELFRVQHDEC